MKVVFPIFPIFFLALCLHLLAVGLWSNHMLSMYKSSTIVWWKMDLAHFSRTSPWGILCPLKQSDHLWSFLLFRSWEQINTSSPIMSIEKHWEHSLPQRGPWIFTSDYVSLFSEFFPSCKWCWVLSSLSTGLLLQRDRCCVSYRGTLLLYLPLFTDQWVLLKLCCGFCLDTDELSLISVCMCVYLRLEARNTDSFNPQIFLCEHIESIVGFLPVI